MPKSECYQVIVHVLQHLQEHPDALRQAAPSTHDLRASSITQTPDLYESRKYEPAMDDPVLACCGMKSEHIKTTIPGISPERRPSPPKAGSNQFPDNPASQAMSAAR